VIAEELAWSCVGIATTLEADGLAFAPLLLGGSEKLKKEYLGRLTEAPLLESFCLTEPGAGSDVSAMRTTAVRKSDEWGINGSKCFITNGEYANWYTVYAKTDREARHRGISAFVVPRDAGVIVDKHEDKMGLRASNTAAITFEGCEIPPITC
jgi:acyl-CoA dehydrogenase